MKEEITEMEINGVKYVREDSINETAKERDGMPFMIIRTYSAGVFAGYVKESDGKRTLMVDAIRIHYWDGAASLSQMALEGVKKPENCRFAMPVEVELTETIERLSCTEKARKNIQGVKTWKM